MSKIKHFFINHRQNMAKIMSFAAFLLRIAYIVYITQLLTSVLIYIMHLWHFNKL